MTTAEYCMREWLISEKHMTEDDVNNLTKEQFEAYYPEWRTWFNTMAYNADD
jgi:hypothetical protein